MISMGPCGCLNNTLTYINDGETFPGLAFFYNLKYNLIRTLATLNTFSISFQDHS
jgi:hypothetical protein